MCSGEPDATAGDETHSRTNEVDQPGELVPSQPFTEPMDHVLVPIDDSDPARAALEYACENYPDAQLTVLYVAEPTDYGVYTSMTGGKSDDEGRHRARSEEVFERARTVAETHGRSISTELFAGDAARSIVQFLEESDVDHVVVGSHGRTGASRVLLGSVAERVARRSPVPVTIVR